MARKKTPKKTPAGRRRPPAAGQKLTHKRPAGPVWVKAFLAAFRDTGNVRRACEAAGKSRTVVYEHRKADPGFAAAFDEAREDAADLLEGEARRRAVDGVDEPVFGSLGGGSGSGQ